MAKCLELRIADKIVLKQQHFVAAAIGGPLKMLVGSVYFKAMFPLVFMET